MPLLGHLALWVALLLGVWGVTIGFAAERRSRPDLAESARRAGVALAVALIVACMALLVALLRQQFNVAYVAAHTDRALPQLYRWAALYAGPEGQMLLWATLVALAANAVDARPSFNAAIAAVVSAAAVVLLFVANPFERLAYTPLDGDGLAADLQDAGFAVAPPLRYAGSALAVIPAALGVAAIVARRRDTRAAWWVGACWVGLTLAIGAEWWWAYRRLGFEFAWVWAPLRSLALSLWLVVSALALALRAPGLTRTSPILMIVAGVLGGLGLFLPRSFGVAVAITGSALLVLIVTAVASWSARPRGLGFRIAAVGCALVLAGLAFQRAAARAQQSLEPGESVTLRSWDGRAFSFTYLAASRYPLGNAIVTRASIEARRATPIGRLGPERRQLVDVFGNDRFAPLNRGDARHRVLEDLYASVVSVSDNDDRAIVRLAINPFVWSVWVGIALAAAGGVLMLGKSRP